MKIHSYFWKYCSNHHLAKWEQRFFSIVILASSLLLILLGCASAAKNPLATIAKNHSKITLIECPKHLNALSTPPQQANKRKNSTPVQAISCFTVKLNAEKTSSALASLTEITGFWLTDKQATSATPPSAQLPLVIMPSGPLGIDFFSHPNAARTLKKTLAVLDWQGAVLALSPRGTHTTAPFPRCQQALAAAARRPPHPATRGAHYQRLFHHCITELTKNSPSILPQLLSLSSHITAKDTRLVLELFNIEKAYLLASAYGTRAALELMAAAPTRIAKVVLEEIFPPGYHPLDHLPENLTRIFQQLDVACQRHQPCQQAFSHPPLSTRLYTVLKYLEANPRFISLKNITHPTPPTAKTPTPTPPTPTKTAKKLQATDLSTATQYYIDAHGYLDYILSQLNNQESLSHLPALIANAYQNNVYFNDHTTATQLAHNPLTLNNNLTRQTSAPRKLERTTTATTPKPPSPTDNFMHTVRYQLWLCNDRNTLLPSQKAVFTPPVQQTNLTTSSNKEPTSLPPLTPTVQMNKKLAKLPKVIQNIVKAEWNTAPCRTLPSYRTAQQNSPRQQLIIKSDIPVLILSSAWNPHFPPQLSNHPSLKLTKSLAIVLAGTVSSPLLAHTCTQKLARAFLTSPQLSTQSLATLKQLPCLKTLNKKSSPFAAAPSQRS